MAIVLKRKWFVSSKLYDITSDYLLTEELSRSPHGKVYKSIHQESGQIRAVKVIQKSKILNYETFISEISTLKDLDHPNIVKIIETFESARLCYLVLEYCSGGDLFDRIIKERHFSEEKAAKIIKSLLSAILYLHSFNVCIDLKPEHCLYVSADPESDIKLIDFGLTSTNNESELLHDTKGASFYIAPEVLLGCSSKLSNCWSLGVILYMLLSGTPPFSGSTNEEILLNIYNASVHFRHKVFRSVSSSAKDLISRLLVKEPEYRLTPEQANTHNWISSMPKKKETLPIEIVENIEKFVKSLRLKKISLMFIASKLSENDIKNLTKIFKKIDINGDGFISKDELKSAMRQFQEIQTEDLEKIFSNLDFNFNGMIDYTEFITACLQTQHYTNRGLLCSAFKFFDQDSSGFITFEDLKQAVSGADISIENSKIEEIIKEADKNQDGKIDYSEFLELMSVKSFISTF